MRKDPNITWLSSVATMRTSECFLGLKLALDFLVGDYGFSCFNNSGGKNPSKPNHPPFVLCPLVLYFIPGESGSANLSSFD